MFHAVLAFSNGRQLGDYLPENVERIGLYRLYVARDLNSIMH